MQKLPSVLIQIVLTILLMCFPASRAVSQFVQQGPKLVASDATGNPLQGISVAVSSDGNTTIVGGSGAAWIYTRDGSGVWSQQGSKLVGSGAVGSSGQGIVSLSGDGNTAIVGGRGDNNSVGAVWVFTRSSDVWTQQGSKVVGTGASGNAQQGSSVALSGDGNTFIEGGFADSGYIGAAWVFTRSGGVWTQQGSKLVGSGSEGIPVDEGLAVALSLDGNTAMIGGQRDNGDVGAVWFFARTSGSWGQQGGKLVGTGAVGSYVHQGWSLALSSDGNTAIEGGYGDDNNGGANPIGAAWVFTRSGGGWSQQGSKLVGTGAVGSPVQGYSVSLSGDGNTAFVGGEGDNNYIGATWVFTRSDSVWSQPGNKLVGTGIGGTHAYQGSSVALSSDGTTAIIGGEGDNNSVGAAWVYTDLLQITAPAYHELIHAGAPYTIRWVSHGVDSLRFSFSLDSGKTFFELVAHFAAAADSLVWQVPDTLSSKCMLVLKDLSDPTDSAIAPYFKIKGYVLTRFDTNGNYEPFNPIKDGWKFGNYGDNMWPQSWWQQFDYLLGDDPYTGSSYPVDFAFVGDSVFPDWPLFVRAFTVPNCYWNPKNTDGEWEHTYRESAFLKWKRIAESWGGSCSGFALTSLFQFSMQPVLSDSFPALGSFNYIDELDTNQTDRLMINQYSIYQYGREHLISETANSQETPREILQDLKNLLFTDAGYPSYLIIDSIASIPFIASAKAAHALVPYMMFAAEGDSTYVVRMYDCNHPGDSTYAVIDSLNDSWNYPALPGWKYTGKGIYLSDPLNSYVNHPLTSNEPKADRVVALLNGSNNKKSSQTTNGHSSLAKTAIQAIGLGTGDAELYNPPNTSVLIKDQYGDSAGFTVSGSFQTVPGAMAIIPRTSHYAPPIGYIVPVGQYSVRLANFADSSSYLTMFADSIIFDYRRLGALQNQTDNINIGSSLSVTNHDNLSKSINLITVFPSSATEWMFKLQNTIMQKGDSLVIIPGTVKDLFIENYGKQKTYDLTVDIASYTGGSIFIHTAIQLDSNSSQHILPNWNTLQTQPLKIFIDHNNTGSFTDSILITNQVTGVQQSRVVGLPSEFSLYQNYPNPFNPLTTIHYSLPRASHVLLAVYNVLGQVVATLVNESEQAGYKSVTFNGNNLSSGLYFYRLTAGNYVATKKLVLLK